MRKRNVLVVGAVAAVLVFGLMGCGGSSDDASVPATIEEATGPAEAQTIVQAATQQIAESVDTKSSVDVILGSWVNIAAADQFANITKEGDKYQYEDNDGKYPAEFVDGILKVKVDDTTTADVYVDVDTGNLKLSFGDNVSEFKKKQ